VAKVDVLIPTYNRGNLLREAVASILRQTMGDFRILIWDDGSTDGSTDEGFLPKDPRIEIYNREGSNKGIAAARNSLLDLVEAPFCAWQDSDDIAHHERLEKMVFALRNTRADLAMSYLYFFNGSWKRKRWHPYSKIDTTKYDPDAVECGVDGNLTHATAVFRPHLKEYRCDTGRIAGSDYLWVKSLVMAGVSFTTVPEYLYYARRHSGRINNQVKSKLRHKNDESNVERERTLPEKD